MTGAGVVEGSDSRHDEDPLDEWLGSIDVVLDRLRDFHLPKDFPFDYSPASMARLESVVLERYPDILPRPSGPGGAFVESVIAYLGEALMRTAGGHWAFTPHPTDPTVEIPLAYPDEALDRPPISPLQLVVDALRHRTGTVFTQAQAALDRAVADRKATHPSWSPTKQRTLADDPEPGQPTEFLVTWLTKRERSFPRWLRDYAGDSSAFDFTPGSLAALGEVVRQTMPGGRADFDRSEHREFVEGAAWYLGEVVRRATDAEWRYLDVDPTNNPLAGRPYLRSSGPDRNIGIPRASLKAATEDPTALDRLLAQFDYGCRC